MNKSKWIHSFYYILSLLWCIFVLKIQLKLSHSALNCSVTTSWTYNKDKFKLNILFLDYLWFSRIYNWNMILSILWQYESFKLKYKNMLLVFLFSNLFLLVIHVCLFLSFVSCFLFAFVLGGGSSNAWCYILMTSEPSKKYYNKPMFKLQEHQRRTNFDRFGYC